MPPFPLDQCDLHPLLETGLGRISSTMERISEVLGRLEPRLTRLEALEEERKEIRNRRPGLTGNVISWLALFVAVGLGVAGFILR